jgi:GntR family transcriptional regulator/MocR family aminotransferase
MAVRDVLIAIDRSRPGRGEQLASALRAAITAGRLAAGTRLPASRDLAAELGVSRGLVVGAYEQLLAEGRLRARRGAGTFVADGTATGTAAPPVPVAPPPVLRPGLPDLGRFPRRAWRRAYERALDTAGDADLDYGDPAGAHRLRAELAGYLGRVRAAQVGPAHLIVTTGAAQALALLAATAPGREIGVEDPGSPSIRDHLAAAGLRPVPVPVDDEGLDVAALAGTGLRAVVITPAHQFPTGVVLSPRRRTELLAWGRRVGGLIVEDDYDAEFRYDREPVGCLQGRAPDLVALVGSVSKALAPALRIGWLAAPPALAGTLARAKSAADHGGPVLEQLALAEFLASGGYDRHLRVLRRVYRARRDAAVRALAEHLPEARVTGVAAGMHLVVTLPADFADVALADRAASRGLGALALSATRAGPSGQPGLVLGYGSVPADRFRAAVVDLVG